MHRITLAREALEAEERRAKEREAELERRLTQFAGDLQREEALIADAAGVVDRLAAEEAALAVREPKRTRTRRMRAKRSRTPSAASPARRARSPKRKPPRRTSTPVAGRCLCGRRGGPAPHALEAEYAAIERERVALNAAGFDEAERAARAQAVAELAEALSAAERETLAAEQRHAEARGIEARRRGPLAEAERAAQRLETEARTSPGLLGSDANGPWPRAVDAVSVARGYEAALGAALGDDLDASVDEAAPAHWSVLAPADEDPSLPAGADPLAARVSAPPALARRLAQVGVVARAEGKRLVGALKPGQRLVSLEGDLWRWDGFVAAAEAPTAAARRLTEKNRLGDLEREAEAARQAVGGARAPKRQARRTSRAKPQRRRRNGASASRAARAASDAARDAFAQFERERAQTLSRLSAVEEAFSRAGAARNEAAERKANAEAALEQLGPGDDVAQSLESARAAAARERTAFAEARAAAQAIARETAARAVRRAGDRRRAVFLERAADPCAKPHRRTRRAQGGGGAGAGHARRRADRIRPRAPRACGRTWAGGSRAQGGRGRACVGRDRARRRRSRRAPGARSDERRARAARGLRGAPRRGAPAGTKSLSTRSRANSIASRRDSPRSPSIRPISALPGGVEVERRLENLRQERERLGAVNLRADDELVEVLASRDKLIAERDDLTEAIKRLRGAIGTLNQEGRERLIAAFDVVNGHFRICSRPCSRAARRNCS